jgi:hypothetical protein
VTVLAPPSGVLPSEEVVSRFIHPSDGADPSQGVLHSLRPMRRSSTRRIDPNFSSGSHCCSTSSLESMLSHPSNPRPTMPRRERNNAIFLYSTSNPAREQYHAVRCRASGTHIKTLLQTVLARAQRNKIEMDIPSFRHQNRRTTLSWPASMP